MTESLRTAENETAVLSWGAGRTGQLGNGTTVDSLVPAQVTGTARGDVVRLSMRRHEQQRLLRPRPERGTVQAWGHSSSGQLGNGGNTNQTVPTTLPRLSSIKDIAAAWAARPRPRHQRPGLLLG